mmetsp:Transcript_38887/g.82761  ORF Transcript_38887/g.82761 Transcript_38887/m.82761 type:complete len:438 (-) Transcript_38887:260-1573(-)
MAGNGFHQLAFAEQDDSRWFATTGNSSCFECGLSLQPSQAWVSWTHAISLCEGCAGVHRALGSHLSRVKSVALDHWTPEEIARIGRGGNHRCAAALALAPARRATPLGFEDLPELHARCVSPQLRAYIESLDVSSDQVDLAAPVKELTEGGTKRSTEFHAEALAERPGYFRTSTGFGYSGGGSQLRGTSRSRVQLRNASAGSVSCVGRVCETCTLGLTDMWARFRPQIVSLAPDNAGSADPRTIFECAEAGDVQGVRRWISEGGASAGDVDELGWTPLLYAVKFGRTQVCRCLLTLSPSPFRFVNTPEQGGLGWVPLQWAAQMGHAECVQLVLEAGAAPNGPSAGMSSKSPLRLATYSATKDGATEQIVELLLGFGANSQGYCSEEFAAKCLQRFAWHRRKIMFLIRDKACVNEGRESMLQKLLQRPHLLQNIAKWL